jgi:flagellar motor switch protein FliG
MPELDEEKIDGAAAEMAVAMARLQAHSVEPMSGARKAAILCLVLGDEAASEVFKHLDEEEVQTISREIATLTCVTSDQADDVLEEFHQLMIARSYVMSGGIEYARRLLVKACGAEIAKRVLDKITRSLESTVGFEALQKADPQQLSKLFQQEHPQTIALVLAHLDASTAADTLQSLPEDQRTDIVLRMANLQAISQDVIRRVSVVLDQKLKSAGTDNRQTVGGLRSVAELCNRLDRDVSQKLIEEMEESNPELALQVRNMMVTFDDLLLIDDLGIRELLGRVDKKTLTLALKGTMPELQQRFFSNMSQKAVEMMKEEMDFLGQVKLKEVTGAQREIVEVMRELDEQGIISLGGGGGEDAYVS